MQYSSYNNILIIINLTPFIIYTLIISPIFKKMFKFFNKDSKQPKQQPPDNQPQLDNQSLSDKYKFINQIQ